MKVPLKRRLNIFSKLRRRLASVKWALLFITTAMFFLSASSSGCGIEVTFPQLGPQIVSQLFPALTGGSSTTPPAVLPAVPPPAVAPPVTGGAPSPVVNTSPVSASPPGITKIVLPGQGSPTANGLGGGSPIAQPNKQGNKQANKKANKKANNQGNNQGG
jgi:hypothetical protein